ncbi:MAG: hypothetical protein ACE5FJ_01045 [Gemmatimonadales bacterium]
MEILAYILIALAAHAFRVRVSGTKLGAFYARVRPKVHPRLVPYVENIHRAESRGSISLSIMTTFLLMATFRAWGEAYHFAALYSLVLTNAAWWIGIPFFQRDVNRGSGLPDVDDDEKPVAEIGDSGMWRRKLFAGKWRRVQPWAGALLIVLVVVHKLVGA